jgi:chromosome segregation ATPase
MSYNRRIEEKNHEIIELQKENGELRDDNEVKVKELNKMRIEAKELLTRLSMTQTDTNETRNKLQEMQGHNERLSRELNETKSTSQQLFLDVERMNEILKENTRYKNALENELNLQSEAIKHLQDQLLNKDEEVQDSVTKLEEATGLIREMEKAIKEMRNQHDTLQDENYRLIQKYESDLRVSAEMKAKVDQCDSMIK